MAELAVKSTGEEEKIYLQLLFVTVAALVLVVFVVSIIFSCWWLKSQKWEDEAQLTDAVYYITLPPEETASKCSRNASQNSYLRPGSPEDPELIELLPTHAESETKQQSGDQRPPSQLYISPSSAGISPGTASEMGMHGASSICPTSYPIPRYVIAGGVNTNVTYGQSPLTESTVLGGAPILISANAAGLLSSPSDGTSSPPVAYVRLAPQQPGTTSASFLASTDATLKTTSNLLPSGGHSSLRMRTLPGRRHVAKEFLDESVVATMTRSRGKSYAAAMTGNRSSVTQPIPEASTMTGQATQPALLSLHTPLVLVPGVGAENVSSLDSAVAVMPGTRAVIPSLSTVGRTDYPLDSGAARDTQLYVSRDPAISLVELFTHSTVPLSISAGSSAGTTVSAAVSVSSASAIQDPLGQGSNETSGIVTDSDGSTNLIGPECAALLTGSTQPSIGPGSNMNLLSSGVGTLVAATPSVASLLASGVSIASRSQPTVVPLSVLTGVSNPSASATYVPTDLIAEMASCPQHSYLFRQTPSTEETTGQSAGRVEGNSTKETVAHTGKEAVAAAKTGKRGPTVSTASTAATNTSSTTGSSASSLQTVVAADEYALGSGAGIPDVPGLFKADFPLTTSAKSSGIQSKTSKADIVIESANDGGGSSTLSRNRHGPSPPKRSVSLTGKQAALKGSQISSTGHTIGTTAHSPGTEISDVTPTSGISTTNGDRTGDDMSSALDKLSSFENGTDMKGDSVLSTVESETYHGEVRSATLGRTSSAIAKESSVDLAPGSSATLPSSGSNPRSALKSADRTGPKVSKQ
ncbi:unnamed protein product [Echinostoma caproni]|uniref:Uncharacterized protein n=1 Tax=Echinostoma caproni TaxID=27848 RepID=A0A183AMR2_9TREM|nr:unnamed protein product [Echinostoma caproni]